MLPYVRLRHAACALLILLVAVAPALADDISKITPTGYVSDLAGVIPSATRQRLEALCSELEQKTGAQLAVVTVRSLDDRPIEDYAVDLFKHLGVGAKKQDTGVLLLVAPNDRKYRIEVGYGLEPVINDARAGDAGRAMVPSLRRNDFGSAVETAAWQLAQYIADDKGVALSGTPPARPISRPHSNSSPLSVIAFFFVLFLFLQILGSIVRRGSGARGGGMHGCWWVLPLLLSSGGPRGRGGWGDGGGSNWGGGGFGGGGGGFGGFGGGSSGGGGASGSW